MCSNSPRRSSAPDATRLCTANRTDGRTTIEVQRVDERKGVHTDLTLHMYTKAIQFRELNTCWQWTEVGWVRSRRSGNRDLGGRVRLVLRPFRPLFVRREPSTGTTHSAPQSGPGQKHRVGSRDTSIEVKKRAASDNLIPLTRINKIQVREF